MKNINIQDPKKARHVSIASKSLLYSGVLILITAVILMITHFAQADAIVSMWLPFMLAGVFLVIMSQMITWKYPRAHNQ